MVHRIRLRLARLWPRYASVVATVAVFVALGGGAYAATARPANSVRPRHSRGRSVRMPTVTADGARLMASGRRFRVFGFNDTLGERDPSIDYFIDPSPPRLRVVDADLAKAARLGANTVRIYLELAAFMRDATHPRATALAALRRVLEAAERRHVYLDITGTSAGTSGRSGNGTTGCRSLGAGGFRHASGRPSRTRPPRPRPC